MVEGSVKKEFVELDRCNVSIAGKLLSEPMECVKTEEYRMYSFDIAVKRFSGKEDRISVMAREEIVERLKGSVGGTVTVDGTLRTYKREDGRSRTWLLAHNLLLKDNDVNVAEIVGKVVSVRETRNDLHVPVCEMRIEVTSRYSKMSRITVVVWGDNAAEMLSVPIGCKVRAVGRVQERGYKGGKNMNRTLEIASKDIEIID